MSSNGQWHSRTGLTLTPPASPNGKWPNFTPDLSVAPHQKTKTKKKETLAQEEREREKNTTAEKNNKKKTLPCSSTGGGGGANARRPRGDERETP